MRQERVHLYNVGGYGLWNTVFVYYVFVFLLNKASLWNILINIC